VGCGQGPPQGFLHAHMARLKFGEQGFTQISPATIISTIPKSFGLEPTTRR